LKVIHNINDFPRELASAVSVGTFDGVHKGHQAIIRRMTDIAEQNGLVSVILTFDPHPRYALKKDDDKLKLLSTTAEKIALLERAGVDYAVLINFSEEFARISYEEFIKDYLSDRLHARFIVIGFDHRFGSKRSGDHLKLIDSKEKYGFSVVEILAQNDDGSAISSTRIRKYIENQQVEQANKLLNYTYSIGGTVVRGTNTGTKLGFPTANLCVDDTCKLIPANGVYVVKVKIKNVFYYGMCNIGFKPTFEKQALTIETHIFDFNKDIYGQYIRISFISFMRDEQKFEHISLLKAQLEIDKQTIIKKINESRP